MNWSSVIGVIIDEGEDKKTETTAHLLRSLTHYGDYGPMAEYESAEGQRFWIVSEYMQECIDNKILPNIPIEVITDQAKRRERLDRAQADLSRQQLEQQTGLVLPDGYNV